MRCATCPKEASITLSYTQNAYCEKHFRHLIIKRIRHDLKSQPPITKNTPYYVDTATPQGLFLKQVISELYDKHVVLTDNPGDDELRSDLLETDVTSRFLSFLQEKKHNDDDVLPLRCVSIEEINAITHNNLPQEQYLHPLLCSLLKHRPGALFAMHHSLLANRTKTNKDRKRKKIKKL